MTERSLGIQVKWDTFIWWVASQVLKLSSTRYRAQLTLVMKLLGQNELDRRMGDGF